MVKNFYWIGICLMALAFSNCKRVTIEQRCCTTEYSLNTQNFKVSDDFTLYVPQAFTPNGDGLNEQFYPVGVGWNLKNMIIKKGTKKYYEGADHIDIYWDGEGAEDGRYHYEMLFVSDKGDEFEIDGHVCLMRYGGADEELAEAELEKVCECTTLDMLDSIQGIDAESKECTQNSQI